VEAEDDHHQGEQDPAEGNSLGRVGAKKKKSKEKDWGEIKGGKWELVTEETK